MNYISLSYRIDALTHCYRTECSWENQHQIRKKKVCESSDYKYYHQAEETKKKIIIVINHEACMLRTSSI